MVVHAKIASRSRFRVLCSLVLFLFVAWPFQAVSKTLIVYPKTAEGRELAVKVAGEIPDSHLVQKIESTQGYDDIVAIGNGAYREALNFDHLPITALFVNQRYYADLSHAPGHASVVVFSEPSGDAIGEQIFKYFGKARIGYIYTDKSDPALHQKSTSPYSLSSFEKWDEDVFKVLSRIYSTNRLDGFLFKSNALVLNKNNVRYVLESLFRNRIPVISTNKALIGNGSVLTIYVTDDAIIDSALKSRQRLLAGKNIHREQFADESVHFDESLSRFYSIDGGRR